MAGFTFDQGAEIEEAEIEESVNITISVFFDGTQNNMKNTEAKMEFEKKQKFEATPSYWAANMTKEEKDKIRAQYYDLKKVEYYEKNGNKSDDSYENDLTNVARLFKYYEIEESNPDDLRACIYIEGIGTREYKSDQVFPAVAFGWSSPVNGSGVLDKVKMGCDQTIKKIDSLRKQKNIRKLTIDVFGFSRGSAAARNFVYQITQEAKPAYSKVYTATGNVPVVVDFPAQPKYGPIGAYFEKNEIEFDIFEVRFAGLYDTVSSFGKNKADDVRELNLDAIKNAIHTLHLAAEDEHRENFPLVKITSPIKLYLLLNVLVPVSFPLMV